MSGLFISYRRSDGGGWAGCLNDHLSLRFGSNVVWQDVDDLEVGTDYLPQILKQIASSTAVLIVIGPHWLKDGQKRLQNPKDVLRIEIRHALGSTEPSSRRWSEEHLCLPPKSCPPPLPDWSNEMA